MKNAFFILLFSFCNFLNLFAQNNPVTKKDSTENEKCGSMLTPEQAKTLKEYYLKKPIIKSQKRERKSNNNDSDIPTPNYCVPITLHQIKQYSSQANLTTAQLQSAIVLLNQRYQNAGLAFYIKNVKVKTHATYANIQKGANATTLINYLGADWSNNSMNVVVSESVLNEAGGLISGYANFATDPNPSQHIVVLDRTAFNVGRTLSHEIGHFLNLIHTHETAIGSEFVNGTNSLTTGDLLLDTPADPGTRDVNKVSGSATAPISINVPLFNGFNDWVSCDYRGSTPTFEYINSGARYRISTAAVDANNILYTPMTNNLMSYYRHCRTSFSAEQLQRARQAYIEFYLPIFGTNPPVLTILPNGSSLSCVSGSVELIGSIIGASYEWKRNGIVISGQTNVNYIATQTGTYTATATVGSCISNTVSTSINTCNPASGPMVPNACGLDFNCTNTIVCNLITNPNFESGTSIVSSSGMLASSFNSSNFPCWRDLSGSPDFFSKNNTTGNGEGVSGNPGGFIGIAAVELPNNFMSGGESLISEVALAANKKYIVSHFFKNTQAGTPPALNSKITLFNCSDIKYNNYGHILNITNTFTASTSAVPSSTWQQAISCFTLPTHSEGLSWNRLGLWGDRTTGSLMNIYSYYDNIELIEDNFPTTPQTASANCGETITLGTPLCSITNMVYEWRDVTSGNILVSTGLLGNGSQVQVAVNGNKTYKLIRKFTNGLGCEVSVNYSVSCSIPTATCQPKFPQRVGTTSTSVKEIGQAIVVDNANNTFVLGTVSAFNNHSQTPTFLNTQSTGDVFVAKYDQNACVKWVRFVNVGLRQFNLKVDAINNLYVQGDKKVIKLDANGAIVSEYSNLGETIYSLDVDNSGNVFIGSNVSTSKFIKKINMTTATPSVIWSYNTSMDFVPNCLKVLSNGTKLATGGATATNLKCIVLASLNTLSPTTIGSVISIGDSKNLAALDINEASSEAVIVYATTSGVYKMSKFGLTPSSITLTRSSADTNPIAKYRQLSVFNGTVFCTDGNTIVSHSILDFSQNGLLSIGVSSNPMIRSIFAKDNNNILTTGWYFSNLSLGTLSLPVIGGSGDVFVVKMKKIGSTLSFTN